MEVAIVTVNATPHDSTGYYFVLLRSIHLEL